MKKILIVNDNMAMGGIQKSLVNLLKNIPSSYDITLLLFNKSGSLLQEIPQNIKIISPNKIYGVLGMNRKELKKHPFLLIAKLFLKMVAKLTSRRTAMKIVGLFQKKYTGYDKVISYSHLTREKDFSNGCGDFVLDKTISNNKICWIHCDYKNSGYSSEKNNQEYSEFDKIVCCSDSVRKIFLNITGLNAKKVYSLRNFYDLNILNLAEENTYLYDEKYINLITVARLSKEKGINIFVNELIKSKRNDIRYYIVGDGPMKDDINSCIINNNLEKQVFILGEKNNPYKYMKNADYFVLPSIHEAAPIVFDEANLLDLPIISTPTTSAKEMIYNGIVSDNLYDVLMNLQKPHKKHKKVIVDNDKYRKEFSRIMEDKNNE